MSGQRGSRATHASPPDRRSLRDFASLLEGQVMAGRRGSPQEIHFRTQFADIKQLHGVVVLTLSHLLSS